MVVLALVAGCMDSPTAAPVQAKAASEQAEGSSAPADSTAVEPKAAEAKPEIPVLTDEDKRLIAADPKSLTPEERRERAYALRRKVMQNPDSPTARALRDMEEAVRNGEVQPQVGKKQYPTLSLPGAKPTGGTPPAGYRPPAGAEESKGAP
jgi:hypothetical protein